jgi:murein DD-endopeptidase MepM/ murein hydrolase activator NlpD
VTRAAVFFLLGSLFSNLLSAPASDAFQFPTANHALFEPGHEDQFFVGTVGKPWTSGMFGCVRSEGWQMHEGIDIKCLLRDNKGEPIDPVMATADATVVYCNKKPSLSNYGNYIILRHRLEGIEVYSLYAHLREIRVGIGQAVRAGEIIAIMGRTTNTHEGISKDRAHVHFELNLLLNDRFSSWYAKAFPNQRNDHGEWNGQNLLGLDPSDVLLTQSKEGSKFSLLRYIRNLPELCRVRVPDTHFPWLKRYPLLVRRNLIAEKEGVVAYEIALNFNGIPFELIPKAASELKGRNQLQLLSVNEAEYEKHHCRKLIVKRGQQWKFAEHGLKLIDLLTY